MVLDLDANATYSPDDSLQKEMGESWHKLGNPSSLHRAGQRARAAIEECRELLRELVGADRGDTIVFTSGATEANAMVISSFARPNMHAVSSSIEHPCIVSPLRYAATHGVEVSFVAPTEAGQVLPDAICQNLKESTTLVSVMAANNETGVINDVATIVREVRSRAPTAVIHTDAAQVVGKLPVQFKELDVDCLTISGHKFGALTGIGALVIKQGVPISPLIRGGPQEGRLRGGTENVFGIISLGIAASAILTELSSRTHAMESVRNSFEDTLQACLQSIEVNGREVARLPNTSSVFISGVRADDLVVALDLMGMYVSAGAACSSGKPDPSHVLQAMGQDEERVRSTVRVSFRADQSVEVGAMAARKMAAVITRIRASERL